MSSRQNQVEEKNENIKLQKSNTSLKDYMNIRLNCVAIAMGPWPHVSKYDKRHIYRALVRSDYHFF